ncbi:MAG: PqqD family protein [marine benthic group bacterium]|nr:PqqD family protein [Gemmatimonadota bacterium]
MSRLVEGTRLRLSDQNVWSGLGEEVVILDLASSSYLGLDDVAAAVWGALAEPRTVGELEALLSAGYEVDPAELSRDLRSFLTDLIDRGLVVLDEEDSQAIP